MTKRLSPELPISLSIEETCGLLIRLCKQIVEERDLLKERLGPSGAEEIVRLKREKEILQMQWIDLSNENIRLREALALAKPGEDK